MGQDVKASTSGQKQTVSEKKKIITVLYEEDIVDGFAIHSFLTYNDLKVSALLSFSSVFFCFLSSRFSFYPRVGASYISQKVACEN